MRILNPILFFIFLCCILLGCKKDEDNAPSTTPENNNSVNQDALIGIQDQTKILLLLAILELRQTVLFLIPATR